MDRVLGSEYRWDVSNIFSILSTQRRLSHEQRLRLKTDGRPCPKVTVKNVLSDTAYEKFRWICGDIEKNTYFCWPCLVMGDLSKVSFFTRLFNILKGKSKFPKHQIGPEGRGVLSIFVLLEYAGGTLRIRKSVRDFSKKKNFNRFLMDFT